ncbi:bacteriohemerythrin [Alkalitalea saponilacus]|uniref:Hemerythrin n=1 Tax=Alkalitalea saponilacus TaxID=889453 RepID=A0A1T5AL74_9BACT|nr:bacteriohemerythrin [Alkalitalea saponilacus]ASB48662.1 hemerythrin [Alkalitalea saponilacus]SKB35801.1 hemerythrin [Alkalitalea saponilacus]
MQVKWTPDLSVSNEGLDKEHQKWIEILNNFYQGILDGSPKEKLEQLVLAMLDYTKYHFASEEEFMKSVNYPDLKEHQEIHAFYVEKITGFYEKIKEGKLILSLEVTNFLKTWLINHIKGTDQQYARYVDGQ